MARPRKSNLSDDELRTLLLKLYVDDDYEKVSDRTLLSKDELIEIGWFVQKGGSKLPVSTGVLNRYKNLLGLDERAVYEFHKHKIGKSYEEWSRLYNRGHTRKDNGYLSDEKIRNAMSDYFCIHHNNMTLKEFEASIKNIRSMLGYNVDKELEEFYHGNRLQS